MPSSCGSFKEANKLLISCMVALCAAEFLPSLRLYCQLPCRQGIDRDASGCGDSYAKFSGFSGLAEDMISPGEQSS